MGDVAELLHEADGFHFGRAAPGNGLHEVGDPTFDVAVCRKASGEVGSFKFDMGDRSEALTDCTFAASYGVEAFFKLSDAAKACCEMDYGAFGNAGGVAEAFCEEDDASGLDWVSPRLSFSQDLTLELPCNAEALMSGRSSAEKRKWQEGDCRELDDGCSSEFEFSRDDVVCGSVPTQTRDIMLSADELFLDGKLLPMHTQHTAPSSSASCGEISMHRTKLTLQECHVRGANLPKFNQEPADEKFLASHIQLEASCASVQISESKLTSYELSCSDLPGDYQKPMARHLSLERPMPILSANVCELAPLVSLSVNSSPCSSPTRTALPANSPPIAATTTSAPHKSNSKYAFKIKDIFKTRRSGSSVNAQLTRENSTTLGSTCRIPIPPRSFWPFARSNSAGESKTTTPFPPTLTPRSNSAGESNTSRVVSPACKSSSEAQFLDQRDTLGSSRAQDLITSRCEDVENLASALVERGSLNQMEEGSKQANAKEESVPNDTSSIPEDGKRSTTINKGRLSGSPGRASRKRHLYTSSNFLRGSPGRRGGMNAKANTSRIVLRNLERCSADRKFSRESFGRRTAAAYPVLRVSPVLNVAVYRGKMPAAGMFGLRRLFSSKKEKASSVSNWRVDA